jgi:hypothetical protein
MTAANRYDAILYPTAPSEGTHPDRLATIATLFGMNPAPVTRCRVLELACGDGGNLIPLAFWLPESRFIGIDLAERPIAAGQELASHLGLKNLTLAAKDVMEIDPDFGEFDYIIAHGLYAWTPPPVQERILAVCRAHLAPQGVAYISYNCYPGSRLRELARDMMFQFARPLDSSPESLARVRQLLGFVSGARANLGSWGSVMNKVCDMVGSRPDNVLAHDEMGEAYLPVYFHEFMSRAQRHDLQYLGEADFSEMNDRWLTPEEREWLSRVEGDPLLLREQYMDFLKCRFFRQTLLCRREGRLRRDLATEAVVKLLVSTLLRPVSERPDLDSPKPEEFRSLRGASLTASIPPVKRLMARLAEAWPRRVPVAELISEGSPARQVGEFLLRLCGTDMISLHTYWNPYVTRAGERPEASRLARLQIERREQVTNQEHVDVRLEGDLARELIRRLDGTRDRSALLAELRRIDPETTPESLETNLTELGNLALLTA